MTKDAQYYLVSINIPSHSSEQWISRRNLAHATGLSLSQVTKAVAHLRDAYPEFPLLSSHQGYRYSLLPGEVERFRAWRLTVGLTICRRTYSGCIGPYLEHLVSSGQLQAGQHDWHQRQFDRVLQDIEALSQLS